MKSRGFTLIELMIVIAILGVLAAIALPNISSSLNKGRRAEGTSALLDLQQAQARLRSNCKYYAQLLVDDNFDGDVDNICAADAANTTLEFVSITPDNEYYDIDIGTAGDGYTAASGNSYTAIATAQGGQLGDKNCRVLILTVNGSNPDGIRTSKNSAGVLSTADPNLDDDACWR